MKISVAVTHEVEVPLPPLVTIEVKPAGMLARKHPILVITATGSDQEKTERKVNQTIETIVEALASP